MGPKNTYRDYDALAADKEPFAIKLGGREITFPPTLAAKVVLDLRRRALATDETDEDQGVEFLLDMGRKAMGDDNFDYIVERIALDQLLDLCTDLMRYYGVYDSSEGEAGEGDEGEADEGEADEGKARGWQPTPEEMAAAAGNREQSASTTLSSTMEPSNPTLNRFGLVPMPNSDQGGSTGEDSLAG